MEELLHTYLIPALATVITGLASYIGLKIKTAYEKYADTKTKKEIVKATVEYIEQIYKNVMVTNEDKFNKAKGKAIEWLNSKDLKISDTELEILIESAVNGLKKTNEVE